MLVIEDLHVSVGGRQVLGGIHLTVPDGETAILFGPNGSGKTTLLMAVMGMPDYSITAGHIFFNGQDINTLPSYERARMGIGMSFQRPPTIHGLKTRQLVQLCAGDKGLDVDDLARSLNFGQFLDRDINDGFSGGEIKRSELLQLMAQQPDLFLFDEPESGVDLDNMALIGKTIRTLTNRGSEITSCLIITHTGYILDYIHADRGYILFDGKIQCTGNANRLLQHIRDKGYRECVRCLNREKVA